MAKKDIDAIQNEILEELNDLPSWRDRFDFIIDLGKELEPLPEEQRLDVYKVSGCVSQVWLVSELRERRLYFKADSDSLFVKGLIALLLEVYSEQEPQAILDHPPFFLKESQIVENLSPNRANGVGSMVAHIIAHAKRALG